MNTAIPIKAAQAENQVPIEILSIRTVGGTTGQLRAIASARLGPVIVDQIRILQTTCGDGWISLPQLPAPAKADGTGASFRPVIQVLDRRVWLRLKEAALEAYRAHLAAGGGA